jgi:hypothetical protein
MHIRLVLPAVHRHADPPFVVEGLDRPAADPAAGMADP